MELITCPDCHSDLLYLVLAEVYEVWTRTEWHLTTATPKHQPRRYVGCYLKGERPRAFIEPNGKELPTQSIWLCPICEKQIPDETLEAWREITMPKTALVPVATLAELELA